VDIVLAVCKQEINIKKTMKTLYKTATILALLGGLAMAAPAAVVIGSWQNNSGDGWLNYGNMLSITNTANTNEYRFVSGVVAGYPQSLQVNQNGFGNDLYIDLTTIPGGKAAFLNNHLISFTFSVPPSGGIYTSGYSQMYSFALNTSVGGYTNVPWSAWTGNSGSMPNFGYYGSFAGGSKTVTWDYSGYLALNPAITNSTWIQITFTGNTGGGAPTNFYMNNVVLSGYEAPTIIVDQFNPTNNPYAGTNIYAVYDEITNVYNLWAGYGGNTAVDPTNIIWDSTQNCTNTPNANANSGALKLIANFAGNNQFVIWNRGPNNTFAMNPPITNGYSLLTFEFDVKYDPSSQIVTNNGIPIFGHLEWAVVPSYTLAVLGSVEVPATNTGWMHVTIPLNPLSDSDLLSISGMIFKQYSGYYGGMNGQSILWLDNLKFTYTNVPPVVPPPTLAIQKAIPALRIFAGDTASINSREELATVNQSQSWIGGTYPVSYSFTLLSYPANIGQTHIFLVPVNSTPGASAYGYNGVDYTATNGLWLVIGPGGGGVIASVYWKTNLPNANAYSAGGNTALRITNSTAIGTWTLTFTGPGAGTVTAPGGSPVAFTIADANVATDFANPLVAYFGLQPNQGAGVGQYEDWASISVTGVAGGNINENFTTETSLSAAWNNMSQVSTCVQLVTTNTPYWVNWTLPAVNYGLGTAMSILGNTNTSGPWMLPEYYNSYNDGNTIPGQANQGSKAWVLIPSTCLPTVDGSQGGVHSPNAFFRLSNPPLAN
jgi:hypothetical protein